jgi:hypothetical protein
LFLARKVSLIRAVSYMVVQCLGAICGVGLVKAFMKHDYNRLQGGTNSVSAGYSTGTALGAEIIGTFVLVYTVFSATDPKRNARDSHVPVCNVPFNFLLLHVQVSLLFLGHSIWFSCLSARRFWLRFLLGSLCSWCTWPPSPSLELVSTQLGALELL